MTEFRKYGAGATDKGHLMFGNVDTVELAKTFGTPLYVMDEDIIRENLRTCKNLIKKHYEGRGMVLYASKALSCLEICRIVNDEGVGLDVASGAELFTAIKSGFPVEKIHFHGNNKTEEEISFAIENGIGRVVIDNIFELEMIDTIARKKNIVINIVLRIKPSINAHTHNFLKTGDSDSKFGFDLKSGEAMEAVKFAKALQNVKICGLHCHIGSQIFDVSPFIKAAEVMIRFISDIHRALSIKIPELNLGGGFGVKYTDDDDKFDLNRCIKDVCDVIKVRSKQYGVDCPFIYIEPGRYIVGNAGITLYRVGAIKEVGNMKTLISVDGSMADNPRYALYGSKYSLMIANKATEECSNIVTVVGRCCESGDIIAKDIRIPIAEIGDVIAVFCTGAYNYSMSSNYNRLPRPAIVMLRNGMARIIVKRESYQDIIRNDV